MEQANILAQLPNVLLPWYHRHKRDLPWRKTREPYHIWISEIMLQQTRVEAVKPYYFRFMEHFPTVEALAAAPDDELMKCWEGLGYYSRARNLKKVIIKSKNVHFGQNSLFYLTFFLSHIYFNEILAQKSSILIIYKTPEL